MSDNSSNSSDSSNDPYIDICFRSKMSVSIFCAFTIINILLLPLFIFVLYLGYQQWRQQRSVSTASTSHSEIFTYHSIAMHLNEFLGFTLFFCGGYVNLTEMSSVGNFIWFITSMGQALFQVLTCVEHYLAVIHPITYLGMKQSSRTRTRNIILGCVWFFSLGWIVVLYFTSWMVSFILYICVMAFLLIIALFCSISVLFALKRPGPGEGSGDRERVDQSKERAFFTIMAIMGVLLLRFGGNLSGNIILNLVDLKLRDLCAVMLFSFWFDLPSNLVLPLLFLHRAGKLHCKQNTESG